MSICIEVILGLCVRARRKGVSELYIVVMGHEMYTKVNLTPSPSQHGPCAFFQSLFRVQFSLFLFGFVSGCGLTQTVRTRPKHITRTLLQQSKTGTSALQVDAKIYIVLKMRDGYSDWLKWWEHRRLSLPQKTLPQTRQWCFLFKKVNLALHFKHSLTSWSLPNHL